MLNILWPAFILISFTYAIFTGNIENVNNSIFESIDSAVKLCITFLGTICMWNGIMKIAQETTFVNKLTKLLKPIINFLFPDIKYNEKAKEEMKKLSTPKPTAGAPVAPQPENAKKDTK